MEQELIPNVIYIVAYSDDAFLTETFDFLTHSLHYAVKKGEMLCYPYRIYKVDITVTKADEVSKEQIVVERNLIDIMQRLFE